MDKAEVIKIINQFQKAIKSRGITPLKINVGKFGIIQMSQDEPIHIVVARDKESGHCFVVTAYAPDRDMWSEDFRSRRK